LLASGDVLVVQTGDIGQVAVVTPEFAGSNCHALIIIRTRSELGSGEWLATVLRSDYGYHALSRSQTGALHPHLECGHVREILIPFPPLEEQGRILAKLLIESQRVGWLIDKVKAAIEHLTELRTALISAAVTGKIDVREAGE
jgi:type I restriction enzyme S subunit